MARRRSSFGGALLACLLALGASGDDFLLLRAAAPFLPGTPADPLPLDDPNTDFTASDDAGGNLLPHAHSPGTLIPRPRVARSLVQTASAPTLLIMLAAGVHLPLRC